MQLPYRNVNNLVRATYKRAVGAAGHVSQAKEHTEQQRNVKWRLTAFICETNTSSDK